MRPSVLDQKYKKKECEADHATLSAINLPISRRTRWFGYASKSAFCIYKKKHVTISSQIKKGPWGVWIHF